MKLLLLFAVVLVLAVVHVNGGGVRRCTYLRCKHRSGTPVKCSSKPVKGNINSIKLVRRYRSVKCRPGRDYVLHCRNRTVPMIRGKWDGKFKVCFTLS